MQNNPHDDAVSGPANAHSDGHGSALHAIAPPVIVDEPGQPCPNTQDAQRCRREKEKSLSDRIKSSDRWMISLTAIIAASTLVQVGIAYLNDKSTSDQMDKIIASSRRIDAAADNFSKSSADISRAMVDAVEQLSKQAQASRDYAELTKRQFIKEQRPYIWHDTIQEDDSNSQFTGVRVYYTNYGKSPALRFSSTGQVFCSKDALEAAYRYLDKVKIEKSWDSNMA